MKTLFERNMEQPELIAGPAGIDKWLNVVSYTGEQEGFQSLYLQYLVKINDNIGADELNSALLDNEPLYLTETSYGALIIMLKGLLISDFEATMVIYDTPEEAKRAEAVDVLLDGETLYKGGVRASSYFYTDLKWDNYTGWMNGEIVANILDRVKFYNFPDNMLQDIKTRIDKHLEEQKPNIERMRLKVGRLLPR